MINTNDDDLKTPKHDEMISRFFMNADINVNKIIGKVELLEGDELTFNKLSIEHPLDYGMSIDLLIHKRILEHRGYSYHYKDYIFIVEFKTKVVSFGEALRQLKQYRRHYDSDAKLVLITYEPTQFKTLFENQGVKVFCIDDFPVKKEQSLGEFIG